MSNKNVFLWAVIGAFILSFCFFWVKAEEQVESLETALSLLPLVIITILCAFLFWKIAKQKGRESTLILIWLLIPFVSFFAWTYLGLSTDRTLHKKLDKLISQREE